MKASLPQWRITQLFDELDCKLTVVSFDNDGNRVFSYGGLNPFLALAEVAHRLAEGQRALILIEEKQQRLPMNIKDMPTDLIWNPGWRDMNKYKREVR